MAQDKGDPFLGAEIRQPLPGKATLHRDDHIVAVGRNDAQAGRGRGGQVLGDEGRARLVQKADLHRPRR